MQIRSYRSKCLKCYRRWHCLLLYQILWHSDQTFLRYKFPKFGDFGIPICDGQVPAVLCSLANLFLYSYEVEFLRSVRKSNKKLAKTSNLTFRYVLTTSSISITQGLSTSSKISTHRNLWFQRYLNREVLCRT